MTGDQLQIGAERANRVENRFRSRVWCVHANRNPGCRRICCQRCAGIARRWDDESGHSESTRSRYRGAHSSRLERRSGIESFVFYPEAGDAQLSRERGKFLQRSEPFAERYGRLTALDSTNGKQLWEFQTGAGMHAPVSTFEHKGKQYVLAFSAGAALLGSARGDSVWLFGLDGTMGPVPAGTPVQRNAVTISEGRRPGQPLQSAEQLRAAADVENGRRVFLQNCSVCHGEDGKSGHGAAPSLAAVRDLEMVMTTVSNGRNAMPSFRTFTAEQVRDVGVFVVGTLAR